MGGKTLGIIVYIFNLLWSTFIWCYITLHLVKNLMKVYVPFPFPNFVLLFSISLHLHMYIPHTSFFCCFVIFKRDLRKIYYIYHIVTISLFLCTDSDFHLTSFSFCLKDFNSSHNANLLLANSLSFYMPEKVISASF